MGVRRPPPVPSRHSSTVERRPVKPEVAGSAPAGGARGRSPVRVRPGRQMASGSSVGRAPPLTFHPGWGTPSLWRGFASSPSHLRTQLDGPSVRLRTGRLHVRPVPCAPSRCSSAGQSAALRRRRSHVRTVPSRPTPSSRPGGRACMVGTLRPVRARPAALLRYRRWRCERTRWRTSSATPWRRAST